MIQTLSAEPAFGVQLSLPVKVQLPAKWNLLGTTADFMVTVRCFPHFDATHSNFWLPVDLYTSYYFTDVVQCSLSGSGDLVGKCRATNQVYKSRGSYEAVTATLNFR